MFRTRSPTRGRTFCRPQPPLRLGRLAERADGRGERTGRDNRVARWQKHFGERARRGAVRIFIRLRSTRPSIVCCSVRSVGRTDVTYAPVQSWALGRVSCLPPVDAALGGRRSARCRAERNRKRDRPERSRTTPGHHPRTTPSRGRRNDRRRRQGARTAVHDGHRAGRPRLGQHCRYLPMPLPTPS